MNARAILHSLCYMKYIPFRKYIAFTNQFFIFSTPPPNTKCASAHSSCPLDCESCVAAVSDITTRRRRRRCRSNFSNLDVTRRACRRRRRRCVIVVRTHPVLDSLLLRQRTQKAPSSSSRSSLSHLPPLRRVCALAIYSKDS